MGEAWGQEAELNLLLSVLSREPQQPTGLPMVIASGVRGSRNNQRRVDFVVAPDSSTTPNGVFPWGDDGKLQCPKAVVNVEEFNKSELIGSHTAHRQIIRKSIIL